MTQREREVALLLTRGLTNRQVARALIISDGIARIHVQRVLAKLGPPLTGAGRRVGADVRLARGPEHLSA
ncbi:MAG: LuxR C-terminal-related transcriptional regulator [Chloroflexota bacterium]